MTDIELLRKALTTSLNYAANTAIQASDLEILHQLIITIGRPVEQQAQTLSTPQPQHAADHFWNSKEKHEPTKPRTDGITFGPTESTPFC